jgi:chromosome segregation ATPase
MEENQTAKMVAWLDEERRKDKAVISRLEERAASQAALIEEQTRRLQSLEGELASLKTTFLTNSLFEEAVSRLRAEINASLEQFEARRSVVDQDLRKMRDIDREALMKSVDEARQEMITRIDRAIQPRRSEEERLSRVAVELQTYADNLSKSLEEFERSLAFLEEQRRQDTRRISDINSEVADLSKRVESRQPKLDLLEDLGRRNERTIAELAGSLNEFKQQRMEWMEQQALADQQRQRTMQDMLRRMDTFAEDMSTFAAQVEIWGETHRVMKQHVEDFQRMVDRVERRLNELGEMQRLSEERFRQEWEEFLGDDQKRWRQFTLTNEEAWRGNAKSVDEIKSQMTRLQERVERQSEHVKYVTKSYQEMLSSLSSNLQHLRENNEDTANSLPALT